MDEMLAGLFGGYTPGTQPVASPVTSAVESPTPGTVTQSIHAGGDVSIQHARVTLGMLWLLVAGAVGFYIATRQVQGG